MHPSAWRVFNASLSSLSLSIFLSAPLPPLSRSSSLSFFIYLPVVRGRKRTRLCKCVIYVRMHELFRGSLFPRGAVKSPTIFKFVFSSFCLGFARSVSKNERGGFNFLDSLARKLYRGRLLLFAQSLELPSVLFVRTNARRLGVRAYLLSEFVTVMLRCLLCWLQDKMNVYVFIKNVHQRIYLIIKGR